MKRRDFIKLGIAGAIMLKYSCGEKKIGAKVLMAANTNGFEYIEAKGTYKEIGVQIGVNTSKFLHEIIEERRDWLPNLLKILDTSSGKEYSDSLLTVTKNIYPHYIEELEGLAEGADVDFADVWAMMIHSELETFKGLEAGCSSIFYKDNNNTWMFHNEDGDKSYFDKMFMLKASPPSGVGFISMIYPGLLAGIGPSINMNGVCQTTNFISSKQKMVGLPRYFTGRAVLESKNITEAIEIATKEPRAFPWHHNLLSCEKLAYATIETLPIGTVDVKYPNDIYFHTNHLLGDKSKDFKQDEKYVIKSSMPRFNSIRKSISHAELPANYPEKFLRFLSSHKGKPYSTCRHPEGNVAGQTLASAYFDAHKRVMRIYKGNPCDSVGKEYFTDYSF